MADSLAPADPYVTRFDATVRGVDDRDVVLDETYFYPEGGGQSADRGTVGGVSVQDVQSVDGRVVHRLAETPEFEEGAEVDCAVDEPFRTYCMRAHTASHALYGASRGLLDDLGYGGFDIGREKVRIDFETTTDIDDATLVELERRVNRAVWESRRVTWEQVPREDALGRDDVAFNARTGEGVSDEETVRIVTIGADTAGLASSEQSLATAREDTDEQSSSSSRASPDDTAGLASGEGFSPNLWDADERTSPSPTSRTWDVAACGGTHVRNTREIGPVSVLGRSNPGDGLTRVEFAVGPTGVERRTTEKAAALDAARALGTGVADVPDAVERLQDDRASLAEEVETLAARLVDARVAELRETVVQRDGHAWLAGTVEGLDANDLGERAQELAGDAADVVALAGEDGATFLAVAAGADVDASEVVDDVTGEFGGGGGGSPQFAQCGGLQCTPDEVVAFLR